MHRTSTTRRKDETHESYRKVCDCLEVVKAHGMKPLTSSSGSKGFEMELEDINPETLKSELGAMIPHDFMYYPAVQDFSDFYKERKDDSND